jgi:hypothetical protein
MNNNIVDYSSSVTYTYQESGSKYAFTIYDDYYAEDDGLEATGNKKVLAVTPRGTIVLTMAKYDGRWECEEDIYRYDAIVEKINAVLISRTNQSFKEAHT